MNISCDLLRKKACTRKDFYSKEGFDEDLLKIGMELYPYYLDTLGHPFFLKEYIRFLVNNDRIEEARIKLSDTDHPSIKFRSVRWAEILFRRKGYLFNLK